MAEQAYGLADPKFKDVPELGNLPADTKFRLRVRSGENGESGETSKYPGAPRITFTYVALDPERNKVSNVFPVKDYPSYPHNGMDDDERAAAGRKLMSIAECFGLTIKSVSEFFEAVEAGAFDGQEGWAMIGFQPASDQYPAKNTIRYYITGR